MQQKKAVRSSEQPFILLGEGANTLLFSGRKKGLLEQLAHVLFRWDGFHPGKYIPGSLLAQENRRECQYKTPRYPGRPAQLQRNSAHATNKSYPHLPAILEFAFLFADPLV